MTQKRKFHFCLSMLLMFVFSAGMVSCNDKDDPEGEGGSLSAPKYEQDAARFTITSEDSPYSSIELTASGNYFITPKPYYMPTLSLTKSERKNKSTNMFNQAAKTTTRASSGIIHGRYTKNANGDYVLEGFGTIKVESNGGSSVDLQITTNSGESIVVGANRDNIMSESDMTNKLCRTWKFLKIHAIFWEEGKKVFDQTMSWKDYLEWDDDFYEDTPENVIFTKAGTYLVTYVGGELAVSTWRWENESKGLLRYSWDYDNLYDEYESGTVQVRFDGNNLVIIEEDYDEEYDERYYFEYFLIED